MVAECQLACYQYVGCTSMSYEASAQSCILAAYNSIANASMLTSANLVNGPGSTALVSDMIGIV